MNIESRLLKRRHFQDREKAIKTTYGNQERRWCVLRKLGTCSVATFNTLLTWNSCAADRLCFLPLSSLLLSLLFSSLYFSMWRVEEPCRLFLFSKYLWVPSGCMNISPNLFLPRLLNCLLNSSPSSIPSLPLQALYPACAKVRSISKISEVQSRHVIAVASQHPRTWGGHFALASVALQAWLYC